MHDSELPMQLRSTGSCEPPGRVLWQRAGNHNILVFLKPHDGISGLLQPFIIIYEEFTFFLHTYI